MRLSARSVSVLLREGAPVLAQYVEKYGAGFSEIYPSCCVVTSGNVWLRPAGFGLHPLYAWWHRAD